MKINWLHFTKKEQELANFVMNNAQKLVYMTITELAEELHVGQGTIVRFCQKLGFSGFHPFKIALARSVGQREQEKETNNLISLVRQNHIEVIEETSKLLSLNEQIIKECSKRIATCRKLFLLGVGASGITAMDAFYKFMRIGIDVRYSLDTHILAMSLSESNEQDCVLAFSQTGSTALVVDMAEMAKKNNSCVIAITAYSRSPLTKYADYVILTAIRESPFQSGAIRSKIAQLHVLEVLFEQTRVLILNRAEEATKRTATAVEKWIY